MNILPGETACLACVFPDSPRGIVETCDTSGILNSAVNLVASIAATEAMKLLSAPATSCAARCFRTTSGPTTTRRCHCRSLAPTAAPAAERDFIHLAGEGRPHITLCGRNSVQIHERQRPIDFDEISRRLTPHGTVKHKISC